MFRLVGLLHENNRTALDTGNQFAEYPAFRITVRKGVTTDFQLPKEETRNTIAHLATYAKDTPQKYAKRESMLS
jgi:hypothetical protein